MRANEHKGFSVDDAGYLFGKLLEEAGELFRAYTDESVENVRLEAADVANVAMMLAEIAPDRSGRKGGLLS